MRFHREELCVFMFSRGKCKLLGLIIQVWHRGLSMAQGTLLAQESLKEKEIISNIFFLIKYLGLP